jgi:hypothetical protein
MNTDFFFLGSLVVCMVALPSGQFFATKDPFFTNFYFFVLIRAIRGKFPSSDGFCGRHRQGPFRGSRNPFSDDFEGEICPSRAFQAQSRTIPAKKTGFWLHFLPKPQKTSESANFSA